MSTSSNSFDTELKDILERVCEFDLNCTPPHDIVEGLSNRGCFTWNNLQIMDDAEIDALFKMNGTRRVPLLGNTSTKIRKLLDFVDDNRVNNVPDSFLTSTYTPENLMEYCRTHRTVSSTPPPSQATSNHNAKSPAEQKLQDWIRGKRSKEDFEVLKEDQHHAKWMIPFEADIVVQGLQNHTDLQFNPSTIPNGFEQQLYDLQKDYFWTVLLLVLKNPLGLTCVSEFYKTRDARAAYIKHHKMQIASPARMYDTTAILGKLHVATLATHDGSRVTFVTSFFELVRELNEHFDTREHLSFTLVKSLLLLAVNSDQNLPDCFDDIKHTGNGTVDIEALKDHLLSKASLYDGKQKHIALLPVTRNSLKSNQHSLETTDEETFYDVEEYSTYQHELADYETATYNAFRTNTSTTPGGRIPDHVWRLMTDENKRSWASMPHDIRSQIITKQNH